MFKYNMYEDLQKRQQEEFNALPIKYAFGEDKIAEVVREFVVESKADLTSIFGAGDIVRRADLSYVKSVIRRHRDELQTAIAEDKTGEGFIRDMFEVELVNHDFPYTLNCRDALWACGLSYDEVNSDPALRHGLFLACERVLDD